jgi:hypothetical protein
VLTFNKPGQAFGQLAVLYDCPRTATVMTSSESVLWHLGRDDFQWGLDNKEFEAIVALQSQRLASFGIMPRSLTPQFGIFDISLVAGSSDTLRRNNLESYYTLCRDSTGIRVTIACFGVWNKAKKTNGAAKVIPAVRSTCADPVRIFFFDDNIEWEGKSESSGICNLRDVQTGAFVDFEAGKNGFVKDSAATNTVVHYSSEYRNVLVQADILDAMEYDDYFDKIIKKYTKPGEKVIVFMDVNSTVISVDAITGKDMSYILLCTLLERIKFRPRGEQTFQWFGFDPIIVKKEMSAKGLAKKMFGGNKEFYDEFYTLPNCKRLLELIADVADMSWAQEGKPPWTMETFQKEYEYYLVALAGGTDDDGIARSWFKCVEDMAKDHCIMINSFGVDTRKLLVKSVRDERQILQLAVDFRQWAPNDVEAFEKMYGVPLREQDVLQGLPAREEKDDEPVYTVAATVHAETTRMR